MGFLAVYSLLVMPMVVHLIIDTSKQNLGIPIKHWLSLSFVIAVALLVSISIGHIASKAFDVYWWQFAAYSLLLHLALFDPLWNWTHGHRWNYHGDKTNPGRAQTDKLWDRVPPLAEVFFRAWIILVGWGIYYRLDWII